jgi:hypothetical protein
MFGVLELSPGGPAPGPQVPEGYTWVIRDMEGYQGGSTSQQINATLGIYTPVGTTDTFYPIAIVTGPDTLLQPAWGQWQGRIVIPELTYLGFQNNIALGAPNIYGSGYQLQLP